MSGYCDPASTSAITCAMDIVREPPAAPVFDVAPPPAQRVDARSAGFSGSQAHTAALRRTLLDRRLVASALPAQWFCGDDPESCRTLTVRGISFVIPESFDSNPVAAAFEASLDRAEQKFRAGRKDKHIGGELGSIVIRKKAFRPKKVSVGAVKRLSDTGGIAGSKRPHSALSESAGASKKARHGSLVGGNVSEAERLPAVKPVDYAAVYRNVVKSDVVKAARQRMQQYATQLRLTKALAAACARDARKILLKSVRLSDDFHRRARRILRDVLQYWKKEDKDRQDERKRLMARAEEARRLEAEEREAQRQRNKLKFLLGQSEAFSSFLQAKAKATDEAAVAATGPRAPTNSDAIDSITGAEDDEELRRKAEANAAELVAAHRQRLSEFDIDTHKRKRVANEMAEQAAMARDEIARSVSAMNGITNDELDALREHQSETLPSKEMSVEASANDSGVAGDEEPSSAKDGKSQVVAVKQPSILNCKMKDYQLRGLSWLVSLYDQGINGILADEMGLGKTLQTISFFAYLAEQEDNWGPFLVVTPKATLHNWQQEVTKFCPDLKVLPYWGSKADRTELRKYWSHKRMYRRDSEFQVCITSYETLTTDEKQFHRVKWQYLVLDEAQAIKNSSSSRWRALLQFPCRNRLLLTGTPLQNKLSELWSLLHFIMPTIFDSHAEFADWFAKDIEGHAKNNKILDVATLTRLRTLLDPFMLRRVKRDVESEMPPKTEIQIRCNLTPRQRQLYSNIRSNIPVDEIIQSMSGGDGGNATLGAKGNGHGRVTTLDQGSSSQLMNIVMQLRKVCNHPETFERRVPHTPYQFQLPPPPTHVPLPPAILSGGAPIPPLDVTLLTRSAIEVITPRLLDSVADALLQFNQLLRRRFDLWQASVVQPGRAKPESNPLRSVVYLGGGLSGSEMSRIVDSCSSALWNWHDIARPLDTRLGRFWEVYVEQEPSVSEVAEKRDDAMRGRQAGSNYFCCCPHWLLLQPRAKLLMRSDRLVLHGFESSTQIVALRTRFLRSTRVYVPAATAPPPTRYTPGDCREAMSQFSTGSKLFYPDMPRHGFTRTSADVYTVWRNVFGNYGEHIGSRPIIMPEAGRLVADSGKMTVLDPLLRRLRSEGHKCLVYSQFTRVLDILEDYCGKTGFKFVRLDGQSALADRRDIVADWQSNDDLFVFLLSTRAGGVGLNLTAADTVIFFDSDWNPTQDLQAMDRAHRLGQERPVTVYRLTSRGTIEERMLIRAQQKSRINDLVIKGGGVQDSEEPREAEIDDIAALLMGEHSDELQLDWDKAEASAGRAAEILKHDIADLEAKSLAASQYMSKVVNTRRSLRDGFVKLQ